MHRRMYLYRLIENVFVCILLGWTDTLEEWIVQMIEVRGCSIEFRASADGIDLIDTA